MKASLTRTRHLICWVTEITETYAYQLRDHILAEPITATITIPFVFVGQILWEIA